MAQLRPERQVRKFLWAVSQTFPPSEEESTGYWGKIVHREKVCHGNTGKASWRLTVDDF